MSKRHSLLEIRYCAVLKAMFDIFVPQCGNLVIFLSIRFYVKSILADFRRSKIAVLSISKDLHLDIWKNFTVKSLQTFKIHICSNGPNGCF